MFKFETITKIEFAREDDFYDLEVPVYHNYVAQGIVHHNSGKDWTSSRLMCYAIYWLLCLKNPQQYFGLKDPKAPIEMVNVSFDEDQAQFVYFKELKKALNSTVDPKDGQNWFAKRGMKVKETSRQQIIEFPHYITCYSLNSKESKVEGKGTLMAVFDEMAVFKTDKAAELYKNLINNMRSRFPKHYKFIALSYKRDDYDFMMVRWDETKNSQNVYRSHKATWEVNLRITKNDLKESYANDPEDAERRFECTGSTSKEGYFKYKDKIKMNVNHKRTSPILEDVIPIRDVLGLKFFDWFVGEPGVEYDIHIDLAKGQEGNDCGGFALGHRKEIVEGNGEIDPTKTQVVIDVMFQVKAQPGKEIIFEEIRQLIYQLLDRGFNIRKVTLDGWQSTDFMQILRSRGMQAELLSVDINTAAYDTTKGLIYQGRLDYYNYSVLIRELEELILKNSKVDHPDISRRRAQEEHDERGSKDVADAVAGVVMSLCADPDKKGNTKWVPLTGGDDELEGLGGSPNTKDPDAMNYGRQYDTNDDGDDD